VPGTPELANGVYTLAASGLELVIDPRRGGRALRFALDGQDALLSPDLASDHAPSSVWPVAVASKPSGRIPPIAEGPCAAAIENTTLVVSCDPEGYAGRLAQRYRLDAARRMVEVTYTLTNKEPITSRQHALELQRVPAAHGLTFFPSAQRLEPRSTLKLNVWQPLVWFSHDQSRGRADLEALAGAGESWLATVNHGLLLLRASTAEPGLISVRVRFDSATQQPQEVSLGVDGPTKPLEPGESQSWTARWYLRKLPSSIAIRAGNPELVGFGRGIIN
jgi:hypothetical protein